MEITCPECSSADVTEVSIDYDYNANEEVSSWTNYRCNSCVNIFSVDDKGE